MTVAGGDPKESTDIGRVGGWTQRDLVLTGCKDLSESRKSALKENEHGQKRKHRKILRASGQFKIYLKKQRGISSMAGELFH